MSHLFQALAERVDAWRDARYECTDLDRHAKGEAPQTLEGRKAVRDFVLG